MNSTTLVLTDSLASSLLDMATRPLERGAVLLARRAQLVDGGLRLIGVDLVETATTAYLEQTANSLGVSSDGYMPALRRAEAAGCVALWVHTHPGGGASARASKRDHQVDQQLMAPFAVRTGTGQYGALIVSHNRGNLTFTGHLAGDHESTIDRMFVAGPRFKLLRSHDASSPELPELHDRHIRAFANEIPRVLGEIGPFRRRRPRHYRYSVGNTVYF